MRRSREHPSLCITASRRGLELLDQPASAIAGAAQGQQDQKDREGGEAGAKRRARQWRSGGRGDESADRLAWRKNC
jgi:hypothetical protein